MIKKGPGKGDRPAPEPRAQRLTPPDMVTLAGAALDGTADPPGRPGERGLDRTGSVGWRRGGVG
jgi:hypothetical protein